MSQQNPNALALMQANEIEMIRLKADVLIKSGFLPDAIKTPEQAIAIMFYGRELNIPDWTALKHIGVIKGSPQVDGQLALALIQRSGLLEQFVIEKSDTKECRLLLKRKGQPAFTVLCTFDEAGQLRTSEFRDGKSVTIALTEKYNWRQQPKTMLFYFTVKQGARRLFSDVLNGMAGSMEGALQLPDGIENAAFYDAEYSEMEDEATPQIPLSVSRSEAPVMTAGDDFDEREATDGEEAPEDDAPNVYHCDRLTIEIKLNSTRRYLLHVKDSPARIVTLDSLLFEGLKGWNTESLLETDLTEATAGVYNLAPPWKVTADLNGKSWDVQRIVARAPVSW